MKKVVLLLTCAAIVCSVVSVVAAESTYPKKRTDILIRDPFVLVFEEKYYMYGTGLAGKGYGCVVSEDLENWSEPIPVFVPDADFDGVGNWWAPECHYYNGRFYLFATYLSAASGKRGTAVFRSDTPTGPFVLHSDGHITPKYRDCIDGTLYVDEDNQPWIVYVSEWTSNPDGIGEMSAARLSGDLRQMISQPVTLFRANYARWTTGTITDGPFVYKTESGRLLMLWSNLSKSGYAVGLAASMNGKVDGRWLQYPTTLYQKDDSHVYDGGHGMLFRDLEGNLRMAIHSPNSAGAGRHETAEFLYIDDLGLTLAQKDAPRTACGLKNTILSVMKAFVVAIDRLFRPFRALLNKSC